MYWILVITEIVICLFLIFVILLQSSKVSLNLTTMWSWMTTITKRGPEKILHNFTIILGSCFILNTLLFMFI